MKTLYFMLLAVVSTVSIAQQSLSGQVSIINTSETVSDATIYFPQLEKGTTTDSNGQFTINNLPSGTQKIVVSVIGFETISQNITLPTTQLLTFEIIPSIIEMDEVILSTPFHKLQRDNVMKVEQEKISDLQAKGAVTLSEGITNIAGVESVTTGLSIGKPVIRGLSSNRVLVYAQGVRLENQQFGAEHGLGVNDTGIESVEVIKGPASLLYGSDALGGVLYLNPERYAASNSSKTDVNTRYFSNTEGYSTNVGFKKSADQFKFLVRASQAEHSDYETKNYSVTNTRFREQDLKAGLGYQSTNFKTDFRYNVNLSKLGIPEEIGAQSNSRTPLEPYQSLTNHILSSKSTWFFNNSSLDVNLGFIYNDRKEFEDHHHDHDADHDDEDHDEDAHEDEDHEEEAHEDEDHDDELEVEAPALHMKLKTFNYDVKYNLPTLGKFETIVGLQGMNQVNTNYGEELLIPDATTNDVGVLATSHIHFETFDVQLGARFDNRNININNSIKKQYNSINGAAGIKASLLKNTVVRLNLASGFRAPNLSELASNGTHEGTNRYEIGNIALKNEQNFQSDLALEYNNKHFEVFANGFYNHINNYIFLAPNGETIDDTPVYNYLQSDARLYGGEFGLHLHPHPLDWLHVESSFETVIGQQENKDYLPLIPANSLTNTLRVEFENTTFTKSYAFVKLKSTFLQSNISAFETTTPSYTLLSAGFGTTVSLFNNPLQISLSGTNLTDKVYINHLSRLKSEDIANMGRNISIGLGYTL